MKKNLIILLITINTLNSFSQINELDNFRQKLTDFINHDTSKYEKSESYTQNLKLELDNSFREFVLLKDFSSIIETKTFEELKKRANNNSLNYLYSFFELRRDYNNKTAKNNVNYYIGFFNLYDYDSPNIVSIYIQPHSIGNEHYMIYYYKMNNKGTYFIKNTSNNEIVYEDYALTSNAPILKFDKIDNKHYLIVEDLYDNGQRGVLVKVENNKWKSINGFKGKSLNIETLDYKLTNDLNKTRKYLWIASNRKITANYRDRSFYLSWISFDEKSKLISYKLFNKIEKDRKVKNAMWKNSFFVIDDYYIGVDFGDGDLPK